MGTGPMRWIIRLAIVLLPAVAIAAGARRGTDMTPYLEFYFPTTGQGIYHVVFDWGEYLILTEAGPDEDLHPDGEAFRGHVTMRPRVAEGKSGPATIYCVTPAGEVWATDQGDSVPAAHHREEVVREGTTTTTTTIESPGEAVILSLRESPAIWRRHGTLEVKRRKTTFRPSR